MENSVQRIALVDRDATVRKEIKTPLAGTDSVSVDMEYADYEAVPGVRRAAPTSSWWAWIPTPKARWT